MDNTKPIEKFQPDLADDATVEQQLAAYKAEFEAIAPVLGKLSWYLGARNINHEEASLASSSAIKEFKAYLKWKWPDQKYRNQEKD